MSVNQHGVKLWFCPGKATWYPEIEELYEQCYVTLKTGILPKEGALEDQEWEFTVAFRAFAHRYTQLKEASTWAKVQEYGEHVIKALAQMFGAK